MSMDTKANNKPHNFYNIEQWSDSYFAINESGELCYTCPKTHVQKPLLQCNQLISKQNLHPPVLVNFPDIVQAQVTKLYEAFKQAQNAHQYHGKYQLIYPIKVNQRKSLLDTILTLAEEVGLEAGSHTELLAIISLPHKKPIKILCNGYKDKTFIESAFIAQSLGHDVTIIIEKPNELDNYLYTLGEPNKAPKLGVRVRLSSILKGNWQNTGGDKSKFGLTPPQLLTFCQRLKKHQLVSLLKILHVRMGSQIPCLADLKHGLNEAAKFYKELIQLDVPIDTVDVGGGLGVDYQGTTSNDYFSLSYTMPEYADAIVSCFSEVCQKHALPHPNLLTESGRAIVAHHSILITKEITKDAIQEDYALVTAEQKAIKEQIDNTRTPDALDALYKENIHQLSAHRDAFHQDKISLIALSNAEENAKAINHWIYQQLKNIAAQDDSLLFQTLQNNLARKIICNFSMFQSAPDIWGLKQVFPVVPLDNLLTEHQVPSTLQDLTCDSDGRVDDYPSHGTIKPYLLVPEQHSGYFAIFMLGAYQETLGDMHNLFGRTHSINIKIDANQAWQIDSYEQGDTVYDTLQLIGFNKDELDNRFESTDARNITANDSLQVLQNKLTSYTYLKT